MDLSKAFDCILHDDLLIAKLHVYDVGFDTCSYFPFCLGGI